VSLRVWVCLFACMTLRVTLRVVFDYFSYFGKFSGL
jgi:hypothetical protein